MTYFHVELPAPRRPAGRGPAGRELPRHRRPRQFRQLCAARSCCSPDFTLRAWEAQRLCAARRQRAGGQRRAAAGRGAWRKIGRAIRLAGLTQAGACIVSGIYFSKAHAKRAISGIFCYNAMAEARSPPHGRRQGPGPGGSRDPAPARRRRVAVARRHRRQGRPHPHALLEAHPPHGTGRRDPEPRRDDRSGQGRPAGLGVRRGGDRGPLRRLAAAFRRGGRPTCRKSSMPGG